MTRHLLTLRDYTGNEIEDIINRAIYIKEGHKEELSDVLKGKTLIMLFQKPSTRTRVSFEVAMTRLGGHAQYVDWRESHLETCVLEDEFKCISRYVDLIMARVNRHEDLERIAEVSSVPIINGLSDKYHPCQVLADLMTIKEKKGSFSGLKLAYVGDGNNVCNSLIVGCKKVGMDISVATPEGYKPLEELTKEFEVKLTTSPWRAVKDADIIYTDTWVSMGKEAEQEKRERAFRPYQVNKELLEHSKSDALIMHCLPAHRGKEITDDVLDSKRSIVFDQAENRLYAQEALILTLLNKL